jgi:hypothetical protein
MTNTPDPEDDTDDIAVLPVSNESLTPEGLPRSPSEDKWPMSGDQTEPEEATPVTASDAPEEDVDRDLDFDDTEDVGSADPISSKTPGRAMPL